MTATYDAKGVPDADAKRAADDAMYRSLCFNSPLLCSPDQRSVAPAELVKFDSVPPGPRSPHPARLSPASRWNWSFSCRRAVARLRGLRRARRSKLGGKDCIVGLCYPNDRQLRSSRHQEHLCRGDLPADVDLDAYRALNFLVRQQFVDPKRVVAVGFSQGGLLSLSSVERGAIEQASENKFRAAAAFYPVCSAVKGPMTVPALILTGESDDWTPAEACRKLVNGQDDWGFLERRVKACRSNS